MPIDLTNDRIFNATLNRLKPYLDDIRNGDAVASPIQLALLAQMSAGF